MPSAERLGRDSAPVARDSIAAVATPAGRGGISIVRVSGGRAPEIARQVLGRLPPARLATLARLRDARGEVVDEGLALYFPAPHSYTGEPVLEFHGHGGAVVTHAALQVFLDAGARLARPGEFTQRAFLEGRLDLAQAEAVADLIDAASRQAARSALRSLSGEFSGAVAGLVARLTELRTLTEAMLDFPEDDVEPMHRDEARRRLERARAALEEVLVKSRQGSLLRSGIQVVLAGRPNVGKSSLLNRLAGEERAIVTAIPGTTRDALRESIQIEGVPLTVVDTAGLRDAGDEVERLGVERTHHELGRADVVLLVDEAGTGEPAALAARSDSVQVRVHNKVDLVAGAAPGARADRPREVWVSARTGAGLDALKREILAAAGWEAPGETVFLARERHLRALAAARAHLVSAGGLEQWELFAEELRLAQAALEDIGGSISANDLLGEIFSRFCIGK